ncbi:MAG: hypothetical protein K1X89_20285 [Myxococcaceae bacterium]|nr:hypothetical protein [Myxococcaceae bacterium]
MTPRRGQSLVLLSLFLFLLTLMVLMTLSLGYRAARRADDNAVADAAAYSEAVATARTFNAAALTNRAITGNYVAMAGLQAQMSYSASVHAYFNLASYLVRMLDVAAPPGGTVTFVQSLAPQETLPSWGTDTNRLRAASYTLWHLALSFYNPAPGAPNPGDEVHIDCSPGAAECTGSYTWQPFSSILLERAAADQVKDLHRAILELARAQKATYRELDARLRAAEFERHLSTQVGLSAPRGAAAGDASRAELDKATAAGVTGHLASFQRTFGEVVLGSRPPEPLMLPAQTAADREPLAPLAARLERLANAALAPNGIRVTFTEGDNSADFSQTGEMVDVSEEPYLKANRVSPGLEWMFGRYQRGQVVVVDTVTNRQLRTSAAPVYDPVKRIYFKTPESMAIAIRSDKSNGEHRDYNMGYGDGMHWGDSTTGFGCHGQHAHYNATTPDLIHGLDDEVLPAELLDFVLPSFAHDGAGGVWGQPKLSVLTHRALPAGRPRLPWEARVTERFSAGSGQTLELRKDGEGSAIASALAYYHRRDHLGEPPNLFNPYWRATLVPMEVDERDDQVDRSNAAARPRPLSGVQLMRDVLPAGDDRAAAEYLYRKLAPNVPGMRPAPVD